jgi:hypothetical protein
MTTVEEPTAGQVLVDQATLEELAAPRLRGLTPSRASGEGGNELGEPVDAGGLKWVPLSADA